MPATPFVITEHNSSLLPHRVLTEHIPEDRIRAYLESGHAFQYDADFLKRCGVIHKNSRDHVLEIYNAMDGDQLKVKLIKGKGSRTDNARLNARKSLSLAQLSKPVRDYLCEGLYADHDISNCHPTLIFEQADEVGLPLPAVERLVDNRAEVFDEIMQRTQCTKDQAKRLPIIMLYGGSVEAWRHSFDDTTIPPFETCAFPWFQQLRQDIGTITKLLISRNAKEWRKVKDRVRKEKGPKARAEPSLLALFAQNIERRVIDTVYSNLSKDQQDAFIYCADGFMLPLNIACTPEFLTGITKPSHPRVQWKMKPFDQGGEIAEFINKVKAEGPPIMTEKMQQEEKLRPGKPTADDLEAFNATFMEEQLHKYEDKKNYMERFLIKVKTGNYWFRTRVHDPFANRGHGLTYRKQWAMDIKGLKHAYGELSAGWSELKNKKGELQWVQSSKKFLAVWQDDFYKRETMDINFRPSCAPFHELPKSNQFYNTFCGLPEHLFDDETTPQPKHEKLVDQWFDILRELVGGNGTGGELPEAEKEDTFRGVVSFLAHTLFRPDERLQHALGIRSAQGQGKGTILDSFGSLLGSEHYLSTSRISDVLGDHSEAMVNRLLVNLNETEASNMKGKQGELKALVDSTKITVNPKHLRPFVIDAFASIIATTNKKNMANVDMATGERRWIITDATKKYLRKVYTSKFWTTVHKGMKTPEFQRALFERFRKCWEDFAEEFDFMAFKHRNARRGPYRQLAIRSTPDVAFYFADFVESRVFTFAGKPKTASGEETASIKSASFRDLQPAAYNANDPVQKFWEQDEFNQVMLYCGNAMVKHFRQWAEENKFAFSESRNAQQFYRMLSDHDLPFEKIDKSGRAYLAVRPCDLYKTLADKKYIDVDPAAEYLKTAAGEEGDDEFGLLDLEF